MTTTRLDELDRRLLNDFQHDFPLVDDPYAEIANRLGTTEADVLARLERLKTEGAISRIGAVVRPNTIGVSTLAAMAVPADRLDSVAQLVSSFVEVNHNYEREHVLNLWFVVTAPDPDRLQAVLAGIASQSGIEVLPFPLIEDYHIDLGFEMRS